ncbi:MAG: hypothetical protein QM501_09210 [Gimesia sp.]
MKNNVHVWPWHDLSVNALFFQNSLCFLEFYDPEQALFRFRAGNSLLPETDDLVVLKGNSELFSTENQTDLKIFRESVISMIAGEL